jgi:hypothetical protein
MTQPFSPHSDPGIFRGSRRRFQPSQVRIALGRASRAAQDSCRNLVRQLKRSPRNAYIIGGAVALTLVGAYTVSASGAGKSLCPVNQDHPQFLLLMDRVPPVAAGTKLEINFDVCGLSSGTPYRGRIALLQPPVRTKKGVTKPKPITVTFRDKVSGPATRRSEEFAVGSAKAGVYTLELTVADNQGRERKRVQKIRVK